MGSARPVRPPELVAAAIDHIALEGSGGVAVGELLDAIEPQRDAQMRRQVWLLLRRQQARGVLHFFYVITPPPVAPAPPSVVTAGKKRKRPTGESIPTSHRAARATHGVNGRARHQHEEEDEEMNDDTVIHREGKENGAGAIADGDGRAATTVAEATVAAQAEDDEGPASTMVRREPVPNAESLTFEDACFAGHAPPQRRKRLFVVACEELRLRALNIPKKAILAEFGDDHLRILEAVGRTRSMGITIPALCDVFGNASSVKKVHNSLDTLISYSLVVKRMMIVARPTMRRLNIVHLPRFATNFAPEMYDESAEFESDEQCKKILSSAAETYLKELPTRSAVLYDLGRDLGFQKRHLEVLKSHIMQETKRDENYQLELFQAVLQPPKKGASIEPKILNCVRYRAIVKDKSKVAENRGMTLETGLLNQIYSAIEDNGESGTTIIDLRNRMVLPGNKLPYKLVSILAGTYGLRAEAIILGKNKAFKLYPMLTEVKKSPAKVLRVDEAEEEVDDITVIPSSLTKRTPVVVNEARYKRVLGDKRGLGSTDQREEMFSVRANLALKVALGGIEVEGTRKRRRDHIMKRLGSEKIISLSSLRASMFLMEKKHAAGDTTAPDGSTLQAHVGMVDTRSVSRIAADLEEEDALRLLQLPLPPRNVSTKFRALRCVILPGYENDEQFIQDYVKNYGRDERLRRIHQNADKNEVVRLRAIDTDDEDVPGFTLFRRPRKRPRVENGGAASHPRPVPPTNKEPTEISYRVRRFVSQEKTTLHSHQYRRLGFAYGVMFRCKQFHQFLWQFLHEHPELHLRDEEIDISVDDDDEPFVAASMEADGDDRAGDTESHPKKPNRGVVFSRETVLHRMPVYLYIQAFSGGSVLTASEFMLVDHAVKNRLGFDVLPPEVCGKVWAHESGRTSKVLGTLTDLKLIVPHKIGMKNLIKILRAGYTDDRDGILAQALKDNALGGLFRLRSAIRIILDERQGSVANSSDFEGEQRREDSGINCQPSIKLVGTTERNFSFGTLLPLQHNLQAAPDVERYWEALEGLCLERMVMEVKNPKPNEPVVCEVPLPLKSRARRMFRILGWIPKSQKQPSKHGEEVKPVKRTGIVSRVIRAQRRTGPVKKKIKSKKSSNPSKNGKATNGELANGSNGHSAQRKSSSASMNEHDDDDEDSELFSWSEEDERQLVDYFIDNCRSRWKITIPQGLQRDAETVAFRVPWLSRSGFGLVSIARRLAKRKIDVKKRLKEKLAEPDAKLLLEAAKREMTEMLNPTGKFDEEIAIFESPRLTALFRRAVMMIMSPQDEYHPIVAEELISFWNAEEIRLVWRYLWLKNWIVRATERERIRGYSMSQRLQDFLKFSTLTYPLSLFQQAAEQEAMVSSTLEEVVGSSLSAYRNNQTDANFEAEFPSNATPGQCALELACQVMGLCSMTVEHAPVVEDADADPSASNNPDQQKTAVMLVRKRTLRFLNYKSQKEGTGFAAHLSKRFTFKNPAILTENWHVETKMTALSIDDPHVMRTFEAFSSAQDGDATTRRSKRARLLGRSIADVVEQTVRDAGEQGVSFEELAAHINREAAGVDAGVVKLSVTSLVDAGTIINVNAYCSQRYVTKEHGDFWLLRSYSLVPIEGKPLPKVVFEGEKDMLSYPWLKMDGSTNYRFLFAIQRKLLSCVLLSPGVTEETVCRRMDRLFTLQDTREALALLVDDGLVYTRATCTASSASTTRRVDRQPSLFGKKRRRPGPSIQLVSLPSSRVLGADRVKYTVHYFPHLECIQRFGSIVQDYQNDVSDAPRV